jgi:hypothetical protein
MRVVGIRPVGTAIDISTKLTRVILWISRR